MSLRVENLSLQRGTRMLQQDLAFAIDSGQALWVRGPNGVGKSTLLEALCGFRPLHTGTIYWQSENVSRNLDQYHASLAYLGHKNGNNENLTTSEALRFYAELYGSEWHHEALARVGLEHRRDIAVRDLSAGQQRRLALARLLLLKAELWILDEPSVSLDSEGVAILADLIKNHQSQGGIVVYTSHVDLCIASGSLALEPLKFTIAKTTDEFLSEDWEGVV